MARYAQSVFRNRSFALFYAGQTLSYVGDGLRLLAIPLLVYHLTKSALSVGLTYALELGPFALFGLLGGSLADRLDRRRLMLVCDFLRFAIMSAIAAGYGLGILSIGALYLGIVAMAIAAAVFIGAQSSTIPYLLGKDRATQAIAALIAAEQSTQMVIPPIGGAIFAAVGPLPALAVNALTYLFSLGSISLVPTFGPDKPGGFPSFREVASDIKLGLHFLWRDAALRTVATNSTFFNLFGFMCAAVFIPFMKHDFGATDLAVGYAYGIGAVGAVIGSWLGGRIPREWAFGRILVIAYIVDGLLFIPIMFTHNVAVLVIFFALTNGCVMLEITQIVGWRIRITPDEMVGRVSGAARLVALIGTVPGAILGGTIADHYGPRSAIILCNVGYIAIGIWGALSPALRREAR